VFLAALSGGADSTAMAAALAALRDAPSQGGAPFVLHALHVNHHIRRAEECAADQGAVSSLCISLNIPFTVSSLAPGLVEAYGRERGTGIEGAARHFRHAALQKEADRVGAGWILMAHTADDQIENILMAFLKGSGPQGLGGLRPVNKKYRIKRPLLLLSRADVLAYLEERGLSYRTDSSNADEKFLRNRIRLRLIPLLDRYFPHWRGPVKMLGETQRMVETLLREETEKRLSWEALGGEFRLGTEDFFSQPQILREAALFTAVDLLGAGTKNPRLKTLRGFARGDYTAADLGSSCLENRNGSIRVTKKVQSPGEGGFSVLIKKPGPYKLETLTVRAFETPPAGEKTGFFAEYPVVLRSWGTAVLAEDRRGMAAMIKRNGLAWKREENPKGMVYFMISDTGRLDALKSERQSKTC
jgi:tRNA(Ile)-lysidine synthase